MDPNETPNTRNVSSDPRRNLEIAETLHFPGLSKVEELTLNFGHHFGAFLSLEERRRECDLMRKLAYSLLTRYIAGTRTENIFSRPENNDALVMIYENRSTFVSLFSSSAAAAVPPLIRKQRSGARIGGLAQNNFKRQDQRSLERHCSPLRLFHVAHFLAPP